MDHPTDIRGEHLAREMGLQAGLHAAYLRDLLDAGFTPEQAFQLVRDHHAVFSWIALVGDDRVPAWLGAPTSSESSASIGSVLEFSKPRLPEV